MVISLEKDKFLENGAGVIFENANMIVVNKPSGVACQGTKNAENSGLDEVLKQRLNKEIYVIHRLDTGVSGLVCFGKSQRAAAELSRMIQDGGFAKEYLAVVLGETPENGHLEDYLFKNQRLNLSKIVQKGTAGATLAVLNFERLSVVTHGSQLLSLLKINLLTGRHHQIRVQMANQGWSIWGDVKYGKRGIVYEKNSKIALFSHKLTFQLMEQAFCFELFPENQVPFNLFELSAN